MAKTFKKGPEIKLAFAIIPAKYGHPRYGGKILRTFIVEELTQILGLANDSDDIKRSMFVKKKSNTAKSGQRSISRPAID